MRRTLLAAGIPFKTRDIALLRYLLVLDEPLRIIPALKQLAFAHSRRLVWRLDHSLPLCADVHILGTCRRVQEIGARIFYAENVFDFLKLPLKDSAQGLGPDNAALVTRISYGAITGGSISSTFDHFQSQCATENQFPRTSTWAANRDGQVFQKLRPNKSISNLRPLIDAFPNLKFMTIDTIRKRWTPNLEQHRELADAVSKTKLETLRIRTAYQMDGFGEDIVYDFNKRTVTEGASVCSLDEFEPKKPPRHDAKPR